MLGGLVQEGASWGALGAFSLIVALVTTGWASFTLFVLEGELGGTLGALVLGSALEAVLRAWFAFTVFNSELFFALGTGGSVGWALFAVGVFTRLTFLGVSRVNSVLWLASLAISSNWRSGGRVDGAGQTFFSTFDTFIFLVFSFFDIDGGEREFWITLLATDIWLIGWLFEIFFAVLVVRFFWLSSSLG